MIDNYFLFGFLFCLILNILIFDIHSPNCSNCIFDLELILNKICIKKGSIYLCNTHIHHWIIGFICFLGLSFFSNGKWRNILQGVSYSYILDGLLFCDRFDFL
jgi:hypothetical protein